MIVKTRIPIKQNVYSNKWWCRMKRNSLIALKCFLVVQQLQLLSQIVYKSELRRTSNSEFAQMYAFEYSTVRGQHLLQSHRFRIFVFVSSIKQLHSLFPLPYTILNFRLFWYFHHNFSSFAPCFSVVFQIVTFLILFCMFRSVYESQIRKKKKKIFFSCKFTFSLWRFY